MRRRRLLWDQLAHILNTWLVDAGAVPTVVIDVKERPQIRLSAIPDFAFSVLALQLLLFVTGSEHVATCSNCGQTYLTKRRPQAGRDHYCSNCGRRAANRAAIQRFREKPGNANLTHIRPRSTKPTRSEKRLK